MKDVKYIGSGLYHIFSEPGDATRYDYIVLKMNDDYCFMPRKSVFRFPQRLNYWGVKNGLDPNNAQEIVELAELNHCNFYTLMECIRTVIELHEEYTLRID
jgi:hypothetical protein